MLLRGATLVSLDPPAVEAGDLRIEGERIAERGRGLGAATGEETLDLAGAVVMPGLVNAHTHLYSALARGMPPPASPPRDFPEILEKVWWRLDRALDLEAVEASALVGGIEAALSGTTLMLDHHASPECIRGSLGALRAGLERVGLRSVLCYEVTDRNGATGRKAGLEENLAALEGGGSPLTRYMLGAHASFTLGEASLEALGEALRRSGMGFHIHVAEDRSDVEDCRQRHHCTILERLDRHGLLLPRTLLAHGVHLTPAEIEEAHTRGCWIAHNARSNMNNAVGHAPTAFLRRGALGTDGMDGDLLAEARTAFLRMREAGRPDAAEATLQLLAGGHRLAAGLFGLPFGKLDAGGPADVAVLDYRPPTPLTAENLAGHLLFGIDRSHVRSVMVAGRWVVRDRAVVTVDAAEAYARARSAAVALWGRMQRG
jgi:putative selenium metabolism protein SsnA